MYSRQPKRSGPPLLLVIVLGIVGGVVFLIIDNPPPSSPINDPTEVIIAATQSPTPEADIMTNTHTPEPTITRTPAPASITPTTSPTPTVTITSTPSSRLPTIPSGASLLVPSAGIYTQIVQAYLDGDSWDVSRLGMNVGHLQGTSWIDRFGNVVLSGHVELADGRPGVFSKLDQVVVGDMIVIKLDEIEHRYQVTEIKETEPNDLTPLFPTANSQLTLITCGTYDFLLDSYLSRTVIVAERIGV